MNDRSLETLTCCLDRLKRQIWWWKIVGSSAIGALGFVVLIGATAQTVPGEIKANRVVIVDDTGKPRIVLGKGKDGKGELSDNAYVVSLADGKGTTTAELYVYDFSDVATESGLELRDVKGKTHVVLRMYSKPEYDHAYIVLRGEVQERPSSIPEVTMEDHPEEITLEVESTRSTLPPAGGVRSKASLHLRTDRVGTGIWLDGKDASLNFSNYAGPPPIGALDKQKGTLYLGMREGRPTLMMGDNVFGMPGLVLGNTSFSTQSGATVQLPAASLVMLDKDGKIVWKAPR